jgi:glycosyltransferase involved in cell wall biosynthesis
MKVTVIPTITAYPWGAPGQCMGALVEELLEAGHQVQWFVASIDLESAHVARLARLGALVVPLPPPPKVYLRAASLRRLFDRALHSSNDLGALVNAFEPNHIFINQGGTWSGLMPQFLPILRASPSRFSLICHLNRPGSPMSGVSLEDARWLADNAARMFFNSRWTRELAELQITRPIRSAAYFQYPVRFSFESPLPWPQSSAAKIAMVNRLDASHKGIDLAIESLARLNNEGHRAKLLVVGRGPDEEYLRDLVTWRRLDEMVTFQDHTEDLTALWAEQEMLLLPSRYEGLAVSMLEAMGFGRPVLRTPYGGCSEWIENGVNGFVCPAAETNMLVDTIKRALGERNRWQQMGLAAHAKIKKNLSPRPAKVFLEALHP